MENIDAEDIMKDAYAFANEMLIKNLKEQRKGLSISVLKTLRSPDVFGSNIGKCMVENLILGAIISYHEQLRNVFLSKGIDIGVMLPDTDDELV